MQTRGTTAPARGRRSGESLLQGRRHAHGRGEVRGALDPEGALLLPDQRRAHQPQGGVHELPWRHGRRRRGRRPPPTTRLAVDVTASTWVPSRIIFEGLRTDVGAELGDHQPDPILVRREARPITPDQGHRPPSGRPRGRRHRGRPGPDRWHPDIERNGPPRGQVVGLPNPRLRTDATGVAAGCRPRNESGWRRARCRWRRPRRPPGGSRTAEDKARPMDGGRTTADHHRGRAARICPTTASDSRGVAGKRIAVDRSSSAAARSWSIPRRIGQTSVPTSARSRLMARDRRDFTVPRGTRAPRPSPLRRGPRTSGDR